MSLSISLGSRTLTGVTSTPSEGAIACIAANWPSPDAMARSRITAARAMLGLTSLSSSSHFAPTPNSKGVSRWHCRPVSPDLRRNRRRPDRGRSRTRSAPCASLASTARPLRCHLPGSRPAQAQPFPLRACGSWRWLVQTGCQSERCDRRSNLVPLAHLRTPKRGPALPYHQPANSQACRCGALGRRARARYKRPECRCAPDQRYELAASDHSITSSARASTLAGTARPSAFAVLRLITVSYLVGTCTGMSAGVSPLRMRSTYSAARRCWSTRSGP